MTVGKALAAIISAFASCSACAAQPSPAVNAARVPNARNVEPLIDRIVKPAMAQDHLAGVTVSVVYGGRTIFSKGYGWADRERRVPVSPSRTLFHIGSITKLFTATATMQLWEQKRLSLNTDVGRYLDFAWPRFSSTPITLAHLMTHTAGFEDSFLGFVSRREDLRPLNEVTRLTVPSVRLVREPGTARSYSNHGILLEGYVVERVSGKPFADYIAQSIFEPLAMSRSSAKEPLSGRLRADLASGYRFLDDHFDKLPDDYINLAPAGAISSTADDMAKFMIAHLVLEGAIPNPILRPKTATAMHSCQYMNHPLSYDCMGFGFFIDDVHGHRVLQHNGGTFSFLSNLVLVPDRGFGIFVSVNSPEDNGLTEKLPKQVIATLFGKAPLTNPNFAGPFLDRAVEYEGYYVPMRRPYGGWLKLAGIGAARVSATGDHSLTIEGFDSPWHQVGSGVFRSRHPDAAGISLVFSRDASGKVIAASLGEGFDKVSILQTQHTALPVIIGFAVCALALMALFCFQRRIFVFSGAPLGSVGRPLMLALGLFGVGAAIIVAYLLNEEAVRGYAPPVGAQMAVWCFNLVAIAMSVGGYEAFRTRRHPAHTLVSRIVLTAFLCSATLMIGLLCYWELIAWSA